MHTTDIPTQALNEAYRAVAARSETDIAKLERDNVGEDELLAALAFTQAAPLIESTDINEAILACCEALSRDLDVDALAEYKFVPLAHRGQIIVAVTSCPWEAMTLEAIRSYFPQCLRVRFVLTSHKTLVQILRRLKGPSGETAPVANDAPKTATAAAPQPVSSPTSKAGIQVLSPRLAPALSSTPTEQIVPARQHVETSPAPTPQAKPTPNLLSPEDSAHLLNLLVKEANELLQRRRRAQL